jgi:NAD(P)-dependent dehydrogenase (short-subunit alcohol dehydrogenase family)
VFRWPLASAYSVSKGAVVKLTENVAAEVSRHGIQVFSFHPGLLPIGFTAAIDRSAIAPGSADEKVAGWVLRERAEGRGAATEDAVAYVVALASGRADALSGRHLSVDDDLDLVLANLDDVAARDLHTLRVRRYTDTG